MAGGACMAGGGGMRDRRDGHCSGRYASYCNSCLRILFSSFILDTRVFTHVRIVGIETAVPFLVAPARNI